METPGWELLPGSPFAFRFSAAAVLLRTDFDIPAQERRDVEILAILNGRLALFETPSLGGFELQSLLLGSPGGRLP